MMTNLIIGWISSGKNVLYTNVNYYWPTSLFELLYAYVQRFYMYNIGM